MEFMQVHRRLERVFFFFVLLLLCCSSSPLLHAGLATSILPNYKNNHTLQAHRQPTVKRGTTFITIVVITNPTKYAQSEDATTSPTL
jgi:hypothetical protein